MSQPVETQPKRTGDPVAAGIMVIVSACLLIAFNIVLVFQLSSYVFMNSFFSSDVFWGALPSLAVSIVLDILALLGGVQALTKRRLMFAVLGTSVLFTISLGGTASLFSLLARELTGPNLTVSAYEVFFIIIYPVVLVLSVLSLNLLAKSRHEFS